MGVMACSRDGCENIMCDRYSEQYGYICGECFNELGTTLLETDSRDIEGFMKSRKGSNWKSLDEVFVQQKDDYQNDGY